MHDRGTAVTGKIGLRILHGPNAVAAATLIVLSRGPDTDSQDPAANRLSPRGDARLNPALAVLGLDGQGPAPPSSAGWAEHVADLCDRILLHLDLAPMPVLSLLPGREPAFVAADLPVSLLCVRMAAFLLAQAESGIDPEFRNLRGQWRNFLAEIEARRPHALDGHVLAACGELGLPCHRPPLGREIQIGEGRHRFQLDLSDTSATPRIAARWASDKVKTNRLLAANGIPVARQMLAESAEEAWRAAREIGLPVVVKPRSANQSRGVTIGVAGAAEMETAFAAARRFGRSVLIESLIPGQDHRVLILHGRVTGIMLHRLPEVVGDGRRSIRALVEAFNDDIVRLRRMVKPIALGEVAQSLLQAEGRDFDFVPAAGETVILHRIAGARRGGVPLDATEMIHPETADMLTAAVAIIGLDSAGVDYRTPDIGRPWHEVGGGICEVNSRCGYALLGIRPHWLRDGLIGPLAAGRDLRMRHLAVFGGDSARPALDALARGLAAALERRQGWRLGLALSDSLVLDGYPASAAALAPFEAYRRAIENPRLDAAVYVVTPEIVAAHGFGLARLDLALFAAPSGLAPAAAQALRDFCSAAQARVVDGVTAADLDSLAAALPARAAPGGSAPPEAADHVSALPGHRL